MGSNDELAIWSPSSNYDAGRNGSAIDRIILHTTEGSFDSALGWLRGAASGSSNRDSSSHYLVSADGQRIAQLVHEADTAWAAGNLAYNRRGINIEQEGYASRGGFTDGLYLATGALVGRIARRHNISLDRAHVIGHMDVPDPNNPALKGGIDHHGDPGKFFDFDRVIAIAKGQTPAQPAAAPDSYTDPVTGFKIIGGMKARWDQLKAALASISPDEVVLVVGRPVGNERVDPDGVTRQDFERATWSWMPGKDPSRFDILAEIINPYKPAK